jgi:hypothetical protein
MLDIGEAMRPEFSKLARGLVSQRTQQRIEHPRQDRAQGDVGGGHAECDQEDA